MISKYIILFICIVLYTLGFTSQESFEEDATVKGDVAKILMPGVRAEIDDDYICTQWDLPEEDLYLVQFGAVIDVGAVHHMLLYGCESSPSSEPYRKKCFGPCSGGRVIYAWGRNAPPTKLPEDVAFHVGRSSNIRTLALQIHYRTAMSDADPLDHSGVSILITKKRPKYLAGVYLLAASSLITIPAHSPKVSVDISCRFRYPATLHPFGFRTHAHDLGRVISGYVYKNRKYGLIGKGNPQWPQSFYPVESGISLEMGDTVVARCTYNASGRDTDTRIGEGHNDEMCNFYIMYYTETGDSWYACSSNDDPPVASHMPAAADQLLPPNPLLDEAGSPHKHHGGMKGTGGHQNDVGDADTKDGQQQHAGHKHPGVDSTNDSGELKELLVEENWPSVQTPSTFGQIAGVAVDQNGQVHIFHRGSRIWDQWSFDFGNNFKFQSDGPIKAKTLVELSKATGQVTAEWGDHFFYVPHGLHIDNEGRFWVTDVALHQIARFEKGATQPSLILGERFIPGSDSEHFCKPADVVTLPSGEFFVADGYCNSRIVKFSKEGKYITEFGKIQSDGAAFPQSLLIPHSLTLLRRTDAGDEVCVADREHARIVCYTINGVPTKQVKLDIFNSALYAIDYSPASGLMYGVTGFSEKSTTPLLGSAISFNNSSLVATFKSSEKGFHNPHDISVSPDGLCVYVVEIGPNKIWKFHNVEFGDGNATSHQSVKKAMVHHPISSDDSTGEIDSRLIRTNLGYLSSSWGLMVVVVSLLLVPITIILAVAICLRMRKNGMKCREGSKNRRFNPGNLLNRHNGFSLLSTMDNYNDSVEESANQELEPLNSDESEVEEYSSRVHLQKA